jgi:lipase maturation factor 1
MAEPTYFTVRWLFLRLLGVIYLIAFVSLAVQVRGLLGANGILPAHELLEEVHEAAAAQHWGAGAVARFPTLCWLSTSDSFLVGLCIGGSALAVLLILDVAPAPVLLLLWLGYLSLAVVGRDFLSFQWDVLLLEAGFLAVFLAPLQLLPGRSGSSPPPRVVLWLLRWLLFRLMFGSGLVKLASGDPNWRNLTALSFHYETQPLPTWIGWYAGHLPLWFQKFSCGAMFAIELGAPLLIFAPRKVRFAGCGALVFLQVLIAATGNYCFFNLLALALCILLLDDEVLNRVMPSGVKDRLARPLPGARRWPRWLLGSVAALLLLVTTSEGVRRFLPHFPVPGPVVALDRAVAPFRSTNTYGLFAVMTTQRLEIRVEGSNDNVNWLPYVFEYKPGPLDRRPAFVAPHQPRLDWQMWFAALGSYQDNPWFVAFLVRLLQGSPQVLALLARNPFPHVPPRYVRAMVYDYHFASLAEHRRTGAWWTRELRGDYCPVLSLRR